MEAVLAAAPDAAAAEQAVQVERAQESVTPGSMAAISNHCRWTRPIRSQASPDCHRHGGDDYGSVSVVAVLLGGGPPGSVPVTRCDSLRIRPLVACLASDLSVVVPAPAWPTSWPDQKPVRPAGRDPSQMCRSVTPTQAGADPSTRSLEGPAGAHAGRARRCRRRCRHPPRHPPSRDRLPDRGADRTCTIRNDSTGYAQLLAWIVDHAPGPRLVGVDRGHPQLRRRAVPRGDRRRPAGHRVPSNPPARPAAGRASPTRSTRTWPCWPRCAWTPTGCPSRAPTATGRRCGSCSAPATT